MPCKPASSHMAPQRYWSLGGYVRKAHRYTIARMSSFSERHSIATARSTACEIF